jgi:hypothetical protein
MCKQPDAFEACPKQKFALKGLVEEMQSLRTQYKEKIDQCLNQKPPFPIQAKANEDPVEKDVEQFVRLVSYCLDAGDTEILETWGIKAVNDKLEILSSKDYGEYCEAFKVLEEESELELEKACMQKLVQFFHNLSSPNG